MYINICINNTAPFLYENSEKLLSYVREKKKFNKHVINIVINVTNINYKAVD